MGKDRVRVSVSIRVRVRLAVRARISIMVSVRVRLKVKVNLTYFFKRPCHMITLVFRRLLVREERKNFSSTSCGGGSESAFNKLKKIVDPVSY